MSNIFTEQETNYDIDVICGGHDKKKKSDKYIVHFYKNDIFIKAQYLRHVIDNIHQVHYHIASLLIFLSFVLLYIH